jgi:hypothetical protein
MMTRRRLRAWRVALVTTAGVGALLGAEIAVSRPAERCFGAAARAGARPCENPRLRFAVIPKPRDALIEPSAPCAPVRSSEPPSRCMFGVSAARSSATVALVGDSHSVHWRAALTTVARAQRWRAVSIYQTRCPLTMARTALGGPLGAQCTRWKQDVLQWIRNHPEVHTVFVSQNTSARVQVAGGQHMFEAKVDGYMSAWRALPSSVRHIVVIRDPPHNVASTRSCIERARRQRKRAGPACARRRDRALEPDAAVEAAARAATPRIRTIDMTRFMCDARRCYPVVGGVLVHKDAGHLTRRFSTTLGPFLLRRVRTLAARWGA